jgi:hypothetical protein
VSGIDITRPREIIAEYLARFIETNFPLNFEGIKLGKAPRRKRTENAKVARYVGSCPKLESDSEN